VTEPLTERVDNPGRASWTPWRAVVWFGVVSLLADMVYEGARSMYGPLLASLGASALLVGLVTGAGEAMALVLRLVFGPLADRSGRYWTLTIAGYGLTCVSVPLLAVSPFVGSAGLALAVVLILLERTGKAVRSPSKTTLLARVAAQVGRGRGFGVHKAMDQTGAFLGPLLVAGVVAVSGAIWAGMLVLAIPGIAAMAVLLWVRVMVPRVDLDEPVQPARPEERRGWFSDAVGAHLPRTFFLYATAASLTTGGLVTFGVISYHLAVEDLVPVAVVPVIYAGAMLAEALAALVVGWLYDRVSTRVLYAVPVLVALVPPLALSGRLGVVLVGVAVWGFAFGLQDSSIKALVAELVEPARHATAYGVFAAVQGITAVAGGALVGWLYGTSLTALVVVVAGIQVVALVLLVVTLRRARPVVA